MVLLETRVGPRPQSGGLVGASQALAHSFAPTPPQSPLRIATGDPAAPGEEASLDGLLEQVRASRVAALLPWGAGHNGECALVNA
jgi:hypothetical protein